MLLVNESSNPEYYFDQKIGMDYCKKCNSPDPIITTFHFYWNEGKIKWNRKHNLAVKSVLATQPKGTKVIVR